MRGQGKLDRAGRILGQQLVIGSVERIRIADGGDGIAQRADIIEQGNGRVIDSSPVGVEPDLFGRLAFQAEYQRVGIAGVSLKVCRVEERRIDSFQDYGFVDHRKCSGRKHSVFAALPDELGQRY